MTHTHTHTQKKQFYRWIGLVVGLFLGLIFSYFYYGWVKKEATIHFQKNIGENKFMAEYQAWASKNPLQAREIAVKTWKELGIYEELKNETDPEKIQQRVKERIEELSDDEKKKVNEKSIKLMQEHAPSFLSSLEKEFPWHLRYYWLIIIFLVLASPGISFLVGYLLEPIEEAKY